MGEDSEVVEKRYKCKVCGETHKIKLNKKIIKGRSKFPFPYVFLHTTNDGLKDVITILYIDANMAIRGVDLEECSEGNLFSKEQVRLITSKLVEEVERLREDNLKLCEEIMKLKKV